MKIYFEHYLSSFIPHIYHFPFFSSMSFLSVGECSFISFLWPRHSYSLSSIAILIHSQHLPYSMLFYTKHRIQQLVATTSICFLASHEGMLIFQRRGGISTHDGCFLFSFSFKAYNFSIEIDIHNIFKTMNSILVISRKHRHTIKIHIPR